MQFRTLTTVRDLPADVTYTSLDALLADFRRFLEKDAGVPIERLELNVALVLYDLCCFIKLANTQRRKVLGKTAAAFVEAELAQRMTLPVVH